MRKYKFVVTFAMGKEKVEVNAFNIFEAAVVATADRIKNGLDTGILHIQEEGEGVPIEGNLHFLRN